MGIPNANGGLIGASVFEDILLAPDFITVPGTLLTGTDYKAGSVLGRILNGAATSATKSGGNTGTGTFVIDGTNPTGNGAMPGVYTLRCVQIPIASTDDAIFQLKNPQGDVVDVVGIPTGGGQSVTINSDIKGVLTDGGTNFVVGDGFDITVPAGSGKFKLSASAAKDGSEVPFGILLHDCDATGGDKNMPIMVEGIVNEEALTFGSGHTADTVRVELRDKGIHLKTAKWST